MTQYTLEKEKVTIEQEIIGLVNNLLLINDNVEISREAASISYEHYLFTLQKFKDGTITINDLNIALREKDEGKNSYVSSIRIFWETYYELRSLTLTDLSAK